MRGTKWYTSRSHGSLHKAKKHCFCPGRAGPNPTDNRRSPVLLPPISRSLCEDYTRGGNPCPRPRTKWLHCRRVAPGWVGGGGVVSARCYVGKCFLPERMSCELAFCVSRHMCAMFSLLFTVLAVNGINVLVMTRVD